MLAVSEAVTNAVEHDYVNQLPGVVVTGLHRVRVIVRDYGRWRLAPASDKCGSLGTLVMQVCMDAATIGLPDNGRPGTRLCFAVKMS